MQIEHSSQFIKARQPRQVAVYLMQNLCLKGRPNECPTTLSLIVFTQRNFLAEFLQAKCNFRRKTAVLPFRAPSLGAWGQPTTFIL